MDTLVKKAISRRKTVNSFLSKTEFIDIGDKETYEKINLEYRKKLGKIWSIMSEIIIREIEENDLEKGFLESLDFLRKASD